MLKKTAIALAALGFSSSVLAGAPGNSLVLPTGTPLIAWENAGYWSFGIEDLYVKSSSPQYQYAQINSNTAASNDPASESTVSNQTVDSDYHNNFEIDATYHFAGTDRDVTLAYMHVDMEDSSTSTLLGNETFSEPFGLLPTHRDFVDQIQGETDQLYNGTDLVFGQHMHIGKIVDIHPFGGLRYADLDSRDNSTYYNDLNETDNKIQATAQVQAHYEGLGPRAGMDLSVMVLPSLTLVGTLGGSLEFGYDNANITTQTTGDLPVTTDLDNGKDWYVVPELDAKLGVDYQQVFNQTTSMDVQLGYQVVNYFNAMDDDTQDIFTLNSTLNRQDFAFQGPYVRFQLNLA